DGSIFGIKSSKFYKKKDDKVLNIFGEKIETPFGPAAGPHSQLAQNILTSYLTGGRFFEVKTVQTLDGHDLPVSKPCINALDECYNVEWSTELYVPEALDEYIKGYMIIAFLSKELCLGDKDGFVYNMSVGYDFKGITSKKIDDYIEGLRDASNTEYFKECKKVLLDNVSKFKNVDANFINSISPNICNSITLSTLHGCPASEIEKIATYLITEKKMNTFIKCNPTLLGYETARAICDKMGYEYLSFDDHHFKNDLQLKDAVTMIGKLKELSKQLNLEFGVKLTNTFPVKIENKELPGEEMYMSGRSLFPLSVNVAYKLASAFNGDLRISFSGGADFFNIEKIFDTGIWPITIATTLLKPGGYSRFTQMARKFDNIKFDKFKGINLSKLEKLANEIDPNHIKEKRHVVSRKINKEVPLIDCYIAPCKTGCPINQDIPEYIKLTGEGKFKEALEVITERNAMPFTTGVLCAHPCMTKCTRIDYEETVNIRGEKLVAAKAAYDEIMKTIKVPAQDAAKVAIIGGGPAGISAGYFLGKNGYKVTIMDQRARMGGVMGNIVPQFRISDEMVDKDTALAKKVGCEFKNNVSPDFDIKTLFNEGYKYIFLAIGAFKASNVTLEQKDKEPLNVISFLESFRKSSDLNLGKNVAIIGAGNSAMDAARAAKRVKGVENVYVVYRRTKALAPAEREEIELAEKEGIKFHELTAPVSHLNG
ncbi:MAG: putative selenate reductase subunit YgfK, partial [Fusobacteriaceae bacterium]